MFNKDLLINKKLAFAISGGKDSMALLYFAIQNLNKKDFFVVTIHHNLRGDEGKRDRDFVVDFCLKNNIECKVYEEDVKTFCNENGYTIEQGARIRRRQIFKEIVDEHSADRVVLAHHMQDQIESILMHIFRGSGIKGLCGMSEDDGILLRPMLNMKKEEIDEYILKNNIPFVQDSTNFELDYSRNRVRHVIIPEIEKVYSNVGDNVIKLSSIAKDAQDYIDKNTPKVFEEKNSTYVFIKDIKSEDVCACQAIINAIEKVKTRVNLEKVHISQIFELTKMENGKEITLPFNVKAIKEYDKIVFYLKEKNEEYNIPFNVGEYEINGYKFEIKLNAPGKLRFDVDKVQGSYITTRKDGLTFKRYKGGRKSLGDYFNDMKIPKRKRDTIPLVVKDNEVLMVIPYEISDLIAISDETKNIGYLKEK